MDFREYGIGAQILRDVGLGKIRLITNYPRRMVEPAGLRAGDRRVRADQARTAGTPRAAPRHRTAPLRARSLEERGEALQRRRRRSRRP